MDLSVGARKAQEALLYKGKNYWDITMTTCFTATQWLLKDKKKIPVVFVAGKCRK